MRASGNLVCAEGLGACFSTVSLDSFFLFVDLTVKILNFLAKVLFVCGLLWVCVVGTAPDVPFHAMGLPLCGVGALLAGLACLAAGRRPVSGTLPVVMAAVLGYFALRATQSPVQHLAEMDGFLLSACVSGFAMVWFTGRVRWLEPWLWLLAIAGTAMGVWQYFVNDQFTVLALLDLRRPIDAGRASGFFYNQNPFGTWCAMLLLMSGASLFVRRGGYFGRALAGAAMLMAAIGLMLTFCRAAFFGVGLGFGVMVMAAVVVVLRWSAPVWKKSLAGGGVLLLVGAAAAATAQWLPVLAGRRTKSGEVEEMVGAVASRFPYWRTGLSQFLDYPWFGAGSRSFSYLSYGYWDKSMNWNDLEPYYAHSEYVQVLADYGFLGFALVVVWGFVAYGRGFQLAACLARRDDTREGRAKLAWCLGGLGAMTAFLADVGFSFSGHFAPMLLLAGCILGGLAAVRAPGFSVVEKPRHKLDWSWQGWLVLGLALAALVFQCVPGARYGLATLRIHKAQADIKKQHIDHIAYLEIARAQVTLLPRYPMWMHAGQYCLKVATASPVGSEPRMALVREAKTYFDSAITVFPDSILTLLERAAVLQELGDIAASDADFQRATTLGHKREFYFRSWMYWGEARFARAVNAWAEGKHAEASAWLREASAAYKESEKLAWVKFSPRWHDGYNQVVDMIAFMKRTGVWQE